MAADRETTGALLRNPIRRNRLQAAFPARSAVQALLGGVFDWNPPPCPVSVEPVTGHPLTAGLNGPFSIHDEHYHVILHDPAAHVFLHTRSEHGMQPAGWTRQERAGRAERNPYSKGGAQARPFELMPSLAWA